VGVAVRVSLATMGARLSSDPGTASGKTLGFGDPTNMHFTAY
jgi:hypothetical protein